jgi:cytochrome c oxidase assembly protein subunit 15
MAPRAFRIFSWALLVYCVAVIVWGALVRAAGAGAGCGSHWPLCNGEVVPAFQQSKTLIEFTHRVMSGLLSVLVLGWAGWAFAVSEKGSRLRKGVLWAVALTLMEGLIGAALVKLRLVENDASPARAAGVGIHLVNTFFLVGVIALTAAWASGQERLELKGQGRVGKALGLGVLLMLGLGVTGAINALGDTLFPAHSLAEGLAQDRAVNASFLLHWRATHPLLALFVTAYLVGASSMTWFVRPSRTVRRRAVLLMVLVALQVVLGVLNFGLLAPVPLQMLHLATANAVWITVVLWASAALAEGVPQVVSFTTGADVSVG